MGVRVKSCGDQQHPDTSGESGRGSWGSRGVGKASRRPPCLSSAMNPYVNCSGPEFSLPQQDFPMEPVSPDLCNRTHPETLFDPKDANLTEEQLRDKYLGPRRSSFFVPVCVIYLLIFVVGALGNTLTCIVIVRHRFMRTPTNYYLFSLAMSDLLVLLLGMPLELYDMWSNYPFLLGTSGCYFKTLLFESVCFASILNVTALSVERYIAVVHPLKAKYVVTRNHAKRVIITIWVLSVICSIPNTSLHGLQPLYVPGRGRVPESEICTLVKPRLTYNLIIQITTIVFFFLPMGTISILYLLIGLQLKKEKMLEALGAKSGGSHDYHNTQGQKKVKRRQVTKMLCESDTGELNSGDGKSQGISPKAVLGGDAEGKLRHGQSRALRLGHPRGRLQGSLVGCWRKGRSVGSSPVVRIAHASYLPAIRAPFLKDNAEWERRWVGMGEPAPCPPAQTLHAGGGGGISQRGTIPTQPCSNIPGP